MKKIFITLFITNLLFIFNNNVFGYEFKIWKDKYSCPWVLKTKNSDTLCKRVAEVCNGQNYTYWNDISFYEQDKKLVKNLLDYRDFKYYTSWDAGEYLEPFDETQKVYKENMSAIFECATNGSKKRALKDIEKNLKITNPDLKQKIQIFLLKQKAELNESNQMCVKKNNLDGTIDNKDLLKISTYEMCKYQTYLEYLKTDYYWNLSNIAPAYLRWETLDIKDIDNVTEGEKKSVYMILDEKERAEKKIEEEINHTSKVFLQTFRTYLSYDYNYNIHLWLEILKIDLKTYNNKLKWVLGPLAQVVPKIINAMKP